MIAIMWQFDVKNGREAEFEKFYGVEGEWTAINRHTRSYLGSSFLRDQNRSSRYIVIEYWSEMVVYEQHRAYRTDAITSLEAMDHAGRFGRAAGNLYGVERTRSNRPRLVAA